MSIKVYYINAILICTVILSVIECAKILCREMNQDNVLN